MLSTKYGKHWENHVVAPNTSLPSYSWRGYDKDSGGGAQIILTQQ